MPALFISYRRADSPDTVKLIHERLTLRLPRWEIFYDHDSIPPGDPFPERLRAKVTTATAVLVIIGPKWLEILRERQSAPIDHVRTEVRLGLESGKSVVPVLVGHAAVPALAELAEFEDLQPLLQLSAVPVRPDPDFDGDLEAIIAHLKSLDPGVAVGTILADKYTLTAEIGDGGMGVVYAAQQKQPVKRTVAVKLIKPDMDSRDVLARFDAERQALAVMDHPNIAKVLDAGLTDGQRPFFVMEYVKGVPITQYCDDKKLSPHDRLNLFIPVCNAVQHAHQKGIIHRDLKPSNVLVEVVDGKPVPKVIDFGLAKALGQKLTDKTLHTTLEMRVGTLEYSAPEQAAGRSFDVDTRSDIYSLGVLLYELLTGAPPFTHEELLKLGEEEMRRVIREVEPTTPSKKLSSSGELPAIASKRHLEPGKLTRMVQGDLDWIVMKCLEKENARRYETANQLGQELQRFLADEPVQAGPPSMAYRTKKFLRRNNGAVVAASLVFLALAAGVVVASTGFFVAEQSATEERKAKLAAQESEASEKRATQKALEAVNLYRESKATAEKRLAQVEKANAVLESVFSTLSQDPISQDPVGPMAPPTLVEQIAERLEKIADTLDDLLIDDPKTMGRLQATIGFGLDSFGGNQKKAIALMSKAHPTLKTSFGPDHFYTLKNLNNLANAYQSSGEPEKELPIRQEFFQKLVAKHGAYDEDGVYAMQSLASAYKRLGQDSKALLLYEKHLEAARTQFGPEHKNTIRAIFLLADEFFFSGQRERAFPLYEDHLEKVKATAGVTTVSVDHYADNLARKYLEGKRPEKAVPLLEQMLMHNKAEFGPVHHETLTSMENLAGVCLAANDPAKAIALYNEVLPIRRKQWGAREYGNLLERIGLKMLKHRQFAAAEPILRDCLEISTADRPNSWATFDTKSILGACLLGQKKYQDAEPLLKEGYAGMKAREKTIPLGFPRLTEALERLVQLYDATGNAAEAERWRKEMAARKAAQKAPKK